MAETRDETLTRCALLRGFLDAVEKAPDNPYFTRRVARMYQALDAPGIDDAAERDFAVRAIRVMAKLLRGKRRQDKRAGLVPLANKVTLGEEGVVLRASAEALTLAADLIKLLPGDELRQRGRFAIEKIALAIETLSREGRPREGEVRPPKADAALASALAALGRPGTAAAVRQQGRRLRAKGVTTPK